MVLFVLVSAEAQDTPFGASTQPDYDNQSSNVLFGGAIVGPLSAAIAPELLTTIALKISFPIGARIYGDAGIMTTPYLLYGLAFSPLSGFNYMGTGLGFGAFYSDSGTIMLVDIPIIEYLATFSGAGTTSDITTAFDIFRLNVSIGAVGHMSLIDASALRVVGMFILGYVKENESSLFTIGVQVGLVN